MPTLASTPAAAFRLCDLGWGVRIGLIGLVLTLMAGLAASAAHLRNHYSPRDGDKSDLTYIDVASAYHGVNVPSPLVTALEQGHPKELVGEEAALSAEERQALLDWLAKDAGVRGAAFDDESLGEMMPALILDRSCVSCHSASPENTEHPAPDVPLFYYDDVAPLAVSREILPTPTKILTASTHAHALTLAVQTLVVVALLLGTRLPRRAVGVTAAVLGLSLAADIAAWWLSREYEAAVWLIFGAGAVFNGVSGLALVAVLVDLVIPGRRTPSSR